MSVTTEPTPATDAATSAPVGRIHVLPDALINRIAAGEVVERPASVIKELVENALDAGATRIEIAVSAGGRNLRVADNGAGMSAEDAARAFLNHATSKLSLDADLTRIHTLGFRGEALASIAAVSRAVCETRQPDAAVGTRVTLSGTDPTPRVEEAGCAPGTVMTVNDLFYNAPARLKFLKKPATELAAIEELVEALAVANPGVRLTLLVNDRRALAVSGEGDPRRTLQEALSLGEAADRLLPVSLEDAELGLRAHGLLSPPTDLKRARRWLLTYVNGRLTRCSVMSKAVETAYASLAPSGQFPYGAIFLTLPLEEVDVNVHPTKREVRYAQPNTVFSFVRQAVARALEAAGAHAMLAAPADVTASGVSSVAEVGGARSGWSVSGGLPPGGFGPASGARDSVGRGGDFATRQASLDFYRPLTPEGAPMGVSSPAQEDAAPQTGAFHAIGQLFNTYILLETPQGLMVVDQHIACERAAFEAFKTHALTDAAHSQQRLMATPLSLNPSEREMLRDHQAALTELGYAFEFPDDASALLTAVPALDADRMDPVAALEGLLSHLAQTGEVMLDRDLLMATMACHSSVRAGDRLSHDAMTRIISRWLACRLPWTCPHGRPIAHTIRAEELNRFFDRPSLPGSA